jgi:2,3-bisphosphoglycerate-independent phosphoglycerate mutase
MDESTFSTPLARAILGSYEKGEEDELLEPLVLVDKIGNPTGRINEGDSIIFYDIRGEREIELTEALTEPDFNHFPARNLGLSFVTMIRYRKGLRVREAFPPLEKLKNTLCEVLSHNGKRIRKITEAEKAIHLSYFLNGKSEESFKTEERVVLPTRKDVATFDQAPEMSANLVTLATCEALADPDADVVIVNLCNVDVVGHFENEESVLKAIETVDESLGKMVSCARQNGVTSVITADHGTVEHWLYPEGTVDTGHTRSPVPFIVDADGSFKATDGELTDVAPTVLHLLGIEKPHEMTGNTLIDGAAHRAKRILLIILDGWDITRAITET